ncbi:outer membrane lipoprotein-sorting protein [Methylicorpusculum sp.]|uniref:outer membrane lipoprotein-sorting protein n=1 Tax=Methylicorpusculum sp. TaxID=2713644 RepID=UPI002725ABF8|nr:outer membrane lipoprotein-sorting protein [Methylicorpusculum sp.]MDO8844075.1 outer membrane lipoprotein-sorting protein [Methylicorpusculum sp.]
MKTIMISIALGFLLNPCFAKTPEEIGLEISEEVVRKDTGWLDSQSELKMILRNRSGDESIRQLRMNTLEVNSDGDKSLTIFDSPADVKGTAFLSYTHALVPDDQWLFLPALKRVKRISSSNKSGPFLGSEFAFEDLNSFEIPKYKYKYLKDEALDGIDCFVVELYPQYEHSGYTRQISWIDKARYIILKVEYYDRKNSLLKTLENKDFKLYLDQFWRPNEMLMTNHQNGKSTSLITENLKFKTGLSERDFDQNTLKRSR